MCIVPVESHVTGGTTSHPLLTSTETADVPEPGVSGTETSSRSDGAGGSAVVGPVDDAGTDDAEPDVHPRQTSVRSTDILETRWCRCRQKGSITGLHFCSFPTGAVFAVDDAVS